MSDDYQRLAVHYSACNEHFINTQKCEREYPLRRAFGECTQYYVDLQKCIRRQRRIQQEASNKLAIERREKIKQKLAENRENLL